jgi:hypothetical protein
MAASLSDPLPEEGKSGQKIRRETTICGKWQESLTQRSTGTERFFRLAHHRPNSQPQNRASAKLIMTHRPSTAPHKMRKSASPRASHTKAIRGGPTPKKTKSVRRLYCIRRYVSSSSGSSANSSATLIVNPGNTSPPSTAPCSLTTRLAVGLVKTVTSRRSGSTYHTSCEPALK